MAPTIDIIQGASATHAITIQVNTISSSAEKNVGTLECIRQDITLNLHGCGSECGGRGRCHRKFLPCCYRWWLLSHRHSCRRSPPLLVHRHRHHPLLVHRHRHHNTQDKLP